MTTTVEGFVSVKSIAKTFAAGKTAERHLYQKLGELGLPNGRVSIKCYWYINIIDIFYAINSDIDISIISVVFFQGDSIDLEVFTFEIFLQIYKDICPRGDIAELFQSM